MNIFNGTHDAGFGKDVDKRSCGYKARQQAISSGLKVLLEMLGQIVKAGVPSKHILFDCWFAYPVTIIEIAKMGLNVVARLKKTPKVKYLLDGEKKSKRQIEHTPKSMSKYEIIPP